MELLEENSKDFELKLNVYSNTWSHQRRRKRQKLNNKIEESTQNEPLFNFDIKLSSQKENIFNLELYQTEAQSISIKEHLNQIKQFVLNSINN
jgi:hypothetical protein